MRRTRFFQVLASEVVFAEWWEVGKTTSTLHRTGVPIVVQVILVVAGHETAVWSKKVDPAGSFANDSPPPILYGSRIWPDAIKLLTRAKGLLEHTVGEGIQSTTI